MLQKIMIDAVLLVTFCITAAGAAVASNTTQLKDRIAVDNVIQPLMRKYGLPGMAIAVTIDGKRSFYNYGVMSKKSRAAVTNETLFEIGSVSKTFTATLASYAQADGKLSLLDNVSKYLPFLRSSSFDNITLLNLGTHTSGGLPLQVPDSVKDTNQLMDYFKNWQSPYAVGTHRSYSNPSIGLLGMITAKAMNQSFDDAIEKKLLPELGMTHTYINVPSQQMKNYAQGYNKSGMPCRMNAGLLSSEAYGLKSNTVDMIRYVEANMHVAKLETKLQHAIDETHTAYFKSGEITQDLVWEQYPDPVQLKQVLAGNSSAMIFEANKATKLNPPVPPQTNVWINKTGSTNGFSSYVVFIPAKKLGIVMLANKNYPIDARVNAAHNILVQAFSGVL